MTTTTRQVQQMIKQDIENHKNRKIFFISAKYRDYTRSGLAIYGLIKLGLEVKALIIG